MGPLPESIRRAIRRRPLLAALLAVALAIRLVTPAALEHLIETRGAAAAGLEIDVGDVDLGLLRGVAALHDVSIAPAGARRGTDGALAADTVLVGWNTLRINVGWLAMLSQTVRLSDIALLGPRVRLERSRTGDINLVELFAGPDEEVEEPEPLDEPASSWRFAADRVSIREGLVSFLDRSVATSTPIELEVDALDLDALAWPLDRSEDGSRFDLDLVVDGATLALTGRAAETDGVLTVDAALDAANLRLVGVRAYTDALGWADLRGLLDAQLSYRLVGDAAHRIEGSLAVRDALVTVPEREDAPLSWRRLAVDGADIDLVANRAALGSIVLEGASVFVDPDDPAISPVVPRAADAEPVEEAEAGDGSDDVDKDGDDAGAAHRDAAVETLEAAEPGEPPAPWSFAVDELIVEELDLRVATPGEPLRLSIDLDAAGLDTAADAISPVAMQVTQAEGSLDVDAELRLRPAAARAKITWKKLDLAALAAAVPDETVRSLSSATTSGRLGVHAGLAPAVDDGGGRLDDYDERDVVVDGELSIAGLEFTVAGPQPFHAAWKDLTVELDRLQLSGALAAGDDDATAARTASSASTLVSLHRLALAAPRMRVTIPARDSEAPAADGGPSSSQPTDDAAGDAVQEDNGDDEAGVEVLIDTLEISDARIAYEDLSLAKPFKGELTADELRARSLRWPRTRALELAARGSALGAGQWRVGGELTAADGRVKLELEGLPLAPLSPLSTSAAGIGLDQGGASLTSNLRLRGDDVDSDNELVLHALSVGGGDGEQRFAETFGIPLSLAIALLKGPGGDISLSLPVSVTRGETTAGITTAVAAVLRQAIVGAVTSPLKLVGAVVLSGNSVSEFSIKPIAFTAATASLAQGADKELAALAELVAARPAMAVELAPVISHDDVVLLKEARIREALDGAAELAAGSPDVSWLARRRLRGHLGDKITGEAEALDDDDRALLDALIAAQPAPAAAMRALAAARLEASESALRAAATLEAGQIRTAALPDPLAASAGPPRVDVSFTAAD